MISPTGEEYLLEQLADMFRQQAPSFGLVQLHIVVDEKRRDQLVALLVQAVGLLTRKVECPGGNDDHA